MVAGADHERATCPLPGVATRFVGEDATVRGVAVAGAPKAPAPAPLTALTRNDTGVPFVRPVTRYAVTADPVPDEMFVQVDPSKDCETTYPLIGVPPVADGAVHESATCPLPGVATRLVTMPATAPMLGVAATLDVYAPIPAALDAATRTFTGTPFVKPVITAVVAGEPEPTVLQLVPSRDVCTV